MRCAVPRLDLRPRFGCFGCGPGPRFGCFGCGPRPRFGCFGCGPRPRLRGLIGGRGL